MMVENPGSGDGHLPQHVAIIMDGNGRWARARGLPRQAGHEAGVRAVRRVVRLCVELGIPALTLYAFSTENWSRPRGEVAFIMNLLVRYLRSDLQKLDAEGVQVRIYGERNGLPEAVRTAVDEAVVTTRENRTLVLGIAFNYGGRDEILRALRTLAREVRRGTLDPGEITQKHLEERLDTSGPGDPDLIIRTGGERRLSNFLLWQAAYAEFWWTSRYWPDFGENELNEALRDFRRRQRRSGDLSPRPGSDQG